MQRTQPSSSTHPSSFCILLNSSIPFHMANQEIERHNICGMPCIFDDDAYSVGEVDQGQYQFKLGQVLAYDPYHWRPHLVRLDPESSITAVAELHGQVPSEDSWGYYGNVGQSSAQMLQKSGTNVPMGQCNLIFCIFIFSYIFSLRNLEANISSLTNCTAK